MQLKACKETNAKQKCLWAERKLLDALKRINYLVFILYITKKNITKLCIRLKSSEKKAKQSDAKTERKQLKSRSIRPPPTPTQIHTHTHTHAQHLDINIMQTDTHIQHTHTRAHLSLSSLLSKK